MRVKVVVFLLLMLAMVMVSQAQAVHVYGRVVDKDDNPVPGVIVTFVKFGCEDCRITAETNDWGVYNIPNYPWCGAAWLGGCNADPIIVNVDCNQAYEWIEEELVCRRFPPPEGPIPDNPPGGENP